MDQNTLRRLPLAAVASHRVTVIKVRMLAYVERNLAARVQADFDVAGVVDFFNGAQFPICNMQPFRWRCELHPVAFGERALRFVIDRNACESSRIVCLMLAVLTVEP